MDSKNRRYFACSKTDGCVLMLSRCPKLSKINFGHVNNFKHPFRTKLSGLCGYSPILSVFCGRPKAFREMPVPYVFSEIALGLIPSVQPPWGWARSLSPYGKQYTLTYFPDSMPSPSLHLQLCAPGTAVPLDLFQYEPTPLPA
jgi:hypothetical protein